MQYFFVKKDISLKLPHKQKELYGASKEDVAAGQIPLNRIYCGFIAWEHISAQQQMGEEQSCLINQDLIDSNLLPYKVKSFEEGGDLLDQLKPILARHQGVTSKVLKIALMNGTGTMLGDNIVGASVLTNVLLYLKSKGVQAEVDVFIAWNARPGAEAIWEQTTGINKVFSSSPTIAELQHYDFYWDYTALLLLKGYSSEHFGDFYLNHFGIYPALCDVALKLPTVKVKRQALIDVEALLKPHIEMSKIILIEPQASTHARSMPDIFLVKLIKQLVSSGEYSLILCCELPKGLTSFERQKIIHLQDWTKNSLDRYLSLVATAQYVVSVDTLALHVAMGCKKPGIGLFALSDPAIRMKYSPQFKSTLIAGAERLPYWKKHKHDDRWSECKADYEAAWDQLNLTDLIEHVNANFSK